VFLKFGGSGLHQHAAVSTTFFSSKPSPLYW
jgi:hypothetical protein